VPRHKGGTVFAVAIGLAATWVVDGLMKEPLHHDTTSQRGSGHSFVPKAQSMPDWRYAPKEEQSAVVPSCRGVKWLGLDARSATQTEARL
jgi:hypothetical protein